MSSLRLIALGIIAGVLFSRGIVGTTFILLVAAGIFFLSAALASRKLDPPA